MTEPRTRTGKTSRRNILAVCVFIPVASAVSPAFTQSTSEQYDVSASDGIWNVLTMAPDGSWGAATESMSSRGIENAVAECRFKYGKEIGCGGYILEFQRGWVLGVRCGNENILAAARELADAERLALWRENQLRTVYARNLPPCGRVVTIDPRGAVTAINGHRALPK